VVSSLECKSEGRVDVLRFLLADPKFQRIEEVNPMTKPPKVGTDLPGSVIVPGISVLVCDRN